MPAVTKSRVAAKKTAATPVVKRTAKTPNSVAAALKLKTNAAVVKPVMTKSARTKPSTPKTVIAKSVVATPAVANPKPLKDKKVKLVRDSFTIPKPEYLVLETLKNRALTLKHSVKKSELLRAGIKALAAMSDAQLLSALKSVPALKSGRPGK